MFDIIILSHVLEHYNGCDVRDVLVPLANFLRDEDSRLLVEVPNTDVSHPGMFRKYHVPHLAFFSAKSLRTLAEECGLSVHFVGACGSPISVAHQLSNGNPRPNKRGSRLRALAHRIVPQRGRIVVGRALNVLPKGSKKTATRPKMPDGAYYASSTQTLSVDGPNSGREDSRQWGNRPDSRPVPVCVEDA